MIRIEGRAAVYGEVWYEEELPRDSEVDIVLYRQRETPIADARTTPFLTMVTDLSAEVDAITEKFGKNCRYKIRRAETKDGLRMEFITDPESRLGEFRAFYDASAGQRSLGPLDPQWLLAACKARQLALSSAAQNGEALVWHTIVGFIGETCCASRRREYSATTGEASSRTNPHRSAPGSTTSRGTSAGSRNVSTTAQYR